VGEGLRKFEVKIDKMREDHGPKGTPYLSSTQRERYMQRNQEGHYSNRKRPLQHSLERDEPYRIPPPRNSRSDFRFASNSPSDYQNRSFGQNRSHSSGRPRGSNEHFHGNREPSHSRERYRDHSQNHRRNSMSRSERDTSHHPKFVNLNQEESFRAESRINQGTYHDNARVKKNETSHGMNNRFIKAQAWRDTKALTQNIAEPLAPELKVTVKKQDPENAKKASSPVNTKAKTVQGQLTPNKDEKQQKPLIQKTNETSMVKKNELTPKTIEDKISGWFKRAPKKTIRKRKLVPDSSGLTGRHTPENRIDKKAGSLESEVKIAKKPKIAMGEIEGGKGELKKEKKATICKQGTPQNIKNKFSSGDGVSVIDKNGAIATNQSKIAEQTPRYVKQEGGHRLSQGQGKKRSSSKVVKQSIKQPCQTTKVTKQPQKQHLKGKMPKSKTKPDNQYSTQLESCSSEIRIETTQVLKDRKLSPSIVSDYTATTLDATESSFDTIKCDNSMLQAGSDAKESRKSSETSAHSPMATFVEVPEQKECDQSDSDSSSAPGSDSDTDEEEILLWGEKMFGVTPLALLEKRLQATESSEDESSDDDDDFDGTYSATQYRRDPLTKAKKKNRKVKTETQEERIRKKEEAKSLTAEQIRAILGDDDMAMPSSNWVRRSSRQPSKDALKTVGVRRLLDQLATNDPDMVVLKMKKYINDPDTPQVVIDAALDALEENTNCQALYIQNFNKGMRDEQVIRLLKILQLPTCKIWCVNIGETYNVKSKTWKRFAKGLKRTKITHMYASEHTIDSEYKDIIRKSIRENRSKHDMHKNPENLDVIIQCTHCWWNPINTKSLRPFIRKRGYEFMLFDKEGQGLRGSTSGAPGSGVKKNPETEKT